MKLPHVFFLGVLVTALSVQSAIAACPPGDTGDILNLEPISSHYTEKVLERAEAGIAKAESFDAVDLDLEFLYFDWLDEITAFIGELLDTDLRLAQEQLDLRQHTACLYIDLEIIEATMAKVQCMISEETLTEDEVNPGKIFYLHTVLMFLNERYRNLMAGGTDPKYRDNGWTVTQIFDTTDYSEEDPLCPFHSNYLPPTIHGYGCDTEVMGQYSLTPVDEENDALEDLIEERNEFIEDSQDLDDLILRLNWFTGQAPPDLSNFGAGLDREHEEFFGCLEENDTSIFARGGTQVELRGPFSFEKDEPKIVREFLEQRSLWGASRPQSEELKFPTEIEDEDEREEAEEREFSLSILDKLVRNVARLFIHYWNIEQSRREAGIIAKSSDPYLQTQKELQGLRTQVKWLAELASVKETGGRLFTAKLGTFLRASCIYRPCNQQLENVLKVTLTDNCFPFVSGEHARMTEADEDPDAKCVQSARLE